MICQHCQHTFLRNYNFCPLCGKPMGEKRCLYCGRSTLLSARFCPGCGRPMDEPLFPAVAGGSSAWIPRADG